MSSRARTTWIPVAAVGWALIAVAACNGSGADEALVVFDVQVATDVSAFTAVDLSLADRTDAPSRHVENNGNQLRPTFRFGYYLPGINGDVTIHARALDAAGCTVGAGSLAVTGVRAGQTTTANAALMITAASPADCSRDAAGAVDATGSDRPDAGPMDAPTDRPPSSADAPDGADARDGADAPGGTDAPGATDASDATSDGAAVKLAQGAPCGAGAECGTTFCADGVCCDQACNDGCHSCALSGSIGTCTTRLTEFNPTLGMAFESVPIVIGSDNNLWFLEEGNPNGPSRMGRITPTATPAISEFLIGTVERGSMALSADNTIWYTDSSSDPSFAISRVDTNGAQPGPFLPDPAAVFSPGAMLFDGGGTWVMEINQVEAQAGQNQIVQLGAQKQVLRTVSVPFVTTSMTRGPDGNIWMIAGSNGIARANANNTQITFSVAGSRDSSVTPIIGVTFSGVLWNENPNHHWIVEAEVGILEEGLGLRPILRLRTGPAFLLLDTRRANGRGSTITLQTQAGMNLWGPEGLIGEYEIARDGARAGLMGQVGLEGVRFTAPRSGWCARVRGTIESLFLRLPDNTPPPPHPFRRWAAGLLLDVGRAW